MTLETCDVALRLGMALLPGAAIGPVPGTTRVRVSATGYSDRRSDEAIETEVAKLVEERFVHASTWTVERPEPEP